MRIGITMEDESGIEGNVSSHLGHCGYFLVVDIDQGKKQITGTRTVANEAQHGGGGCQAVNEILKHSVTHVISGGMGMGAQQKFAAAGVQVLGYSGKVKDAIGKFLDEALGGIEPCPGHEGTCHH